ncbi:dephospho-CoA kinase [Jatrophihabitans fulvus]
MGLTGGVGSGKSTVARLLAQRGAVVLDADAIAREVVEPGTEGFDAVVEHFGRSAVAADGTLDRAWIARTVFADRAQLDALNSITHPRVARRFAELEAQAPAEAVVVYDVPLLVENGMADGFDLVVVVLASEAIRLTRLAGRGMAEDDARARMARQATDEQRRAVADEIIDNDGDLASLERQVDAVWTRITDRAGEAV